MSPKALERQAFGRFQVDVRACNGRKGFPHVASDALEPGERAQVRDRLLGTILAAVREGVLTKDDLVALVGGVEPAADHRQLALGIRATHVAEPERTVQARHFLDEPERSVRGRSKLEET